MATTYTYVSLGNLQRYDDLLKQYLSNKITTEIASSLKTVSLDGNILKFYTVAEPVGTTAPVFTLELPTEDLSGFLKKFSGATTGDVVIVGDDGKVIKDSGIKLSDLATSSNVDEKIANAKKLIDADIKTNTDAITKLNGDATVTGSIKEQIKTASDALDSKITKNTEAIQAHKDAIDAKVTTLIGSDTNKSVRTIANEELAAQLIPENAKESLDTLQEIAAWIQKHPDDATAMNNAITALQALVGTIPTGVTATNIVGYIQELVDAEKTRASGVESDLDSRLKTVEGLVGEDGSVDEKITAAKNEAINTASADATTKANTAESNAKTYADTQVKTLSDGQVATNTTDIANLDGRVDALESVSFVAVTTEEINAMFSTQS